MKQAVIVHYVECFSRLSETFLYHQPVFQDRIGLNSHVLTEQRILEEDRPFPRVRVVRRPPRASVSSLSARLRRHLWGDPTWNRSTPVLVRALRAMGANLLHVHYGWSGIHLLSAARALELPYVVSFYGRDVTEDSPGRVRPELVRLFHEAGLVLALSERMAQRLNDIGCPEDKLRVHHLGLDLKRLPYLEPKAPQGNSRVVSLGRLVPKKGMDVLLSAIHALSLREQIVSLDIIGDGPMEADLRHLAHELGIQDRVQFLGAMPHHEAMRRLTDYDVFVLASRTAPDGDAEGTPTVLLEAQALGMPLISTLHEGIPECLPPRNRRWLVPEGDPEALADRLGELLAGAADWKAISRRGRDWIEDQFDAAGLARDAAAIYQGVLDDAVPDAPRVL